MPSRRSGRGGGRRRRLGLSVYFAALVGLFLLSAAGGLMYVRLQGDSDARHAALHDASFAATSASRLLASGAKVLETALAATVADPTSDRELLAHPDKCVLSYSPVGAFPVGHIEILRPDGSVVCSSLTRPALRARGYVGAGWLPRARTRQLSLAPVLDPQTRTPAALFSVPFSGGIVVALVALRPVGLNLVSQLGGPRDIAYVVTTEDGRRALSSSIEPGRWAGASLAGTAFLRESARSDRPGLTGRPRLFSQARADGLAWRVYAGVDRARALAAAGRLFDRVLVLILGTLVVLVLAVALLHARIVGPVKRLRAAMQAGDGGTVRGPAPLAGPAELAELSESFAQLTGRVRLELAERERAERRSRELADGYRLLFENNPEPMWVYDAETLEIFEVNEAAIRQYGYSREEFLSLTLMDIRAAEDVPALMESVAGAGRTDQSGPWRHLKRDGTPLEVEIVSHEVTLGGRRGRLVMASDVTERERLQRQLAQVQRLEGLGQLAGGVAHDFNNLLGVILNYAAFVREELDKLGAGADDGRLGAVRSDVGQIQVAARRAATLTHQLLAFARREPIRPEVITLNSVVEETEQLLRRTLGEHIELTCTLGEELWPVLVDPGQVEQVLVNLAVNARDALGEGGRLVIETANLEVDESFAATRPGLEPGRYVRLRVSDNGHGMEAETLERAFEPFFTTKPKGEGTGLGLATIYGIVTQAGGRVQLYSEPGVGTTCTVMIPATEQPVAPPAAPAEKALGQGEVVLLVEDEDGIREVANRILTGNGYTVLAAAGGPEALDLAAAHDGPIDLLLTDVIMPRMMGMELAERLVRSRPGTRVLYMSGYAQPILGANETVPAGVILVEKPFSEQELLAKVHEALTAAATVT